MKLDHPRNKAICPKYNCYGNRQWDSVLQMHNTTKPVYKRHSPRR